MSLNEGREYLYWKSESRQVFPEGISKDRGDGCFRTVSPLYLSSHHSVDVEVSCTKVYSVTWNGLRIQIGYQIRALFRSRQGAMRHLIIPPRSPKDF